MATKSSFVTRSERHGKCGRSWADITEGNFYDSLLVYLDVEFSEDRLRRALNIDRPGFEELLRLVVFFRA